MQNRAQNYIKILIGARFFVKKFITLQAKWRIENGELRIENGELRIETINTKYYEEIIFVFGSCCCYGGMFT